MFREHCEEYTYKYIQKYRLWTIQRWSYLSTPALSIRCVLIPIFTVRYVITRHPLSGVLSSLSGNTWYFGSRAKIYQQPLTSVSSFCAPGPSVSAITSSVKSTIKRAAVVVVERWGAHEWIWNTAVLYTEWHVTTIYEKYVLLSVNKNVQCQNETGW